MADAQCLIESDATGHSEKFKQGLYAMRNDPETSDVTLICEDMKVVKHELIEARRVKRRLESLRIYQSTAQVLSVHSVCFICFSTGVCITDSFVYLVWFVNKIENSSNS